MPAVHQRISEYLLVEPIGKGSFGEVWLARHHVWEDQRVAIKIPTDPSYVRNLQSEGTAIHGLSHPNIVRAIGCDPYSDPPYLIMEYVPGSSLRPLIQRRQIRLEQAIKLMQQVLTGLAHAHDKGVIHRDIKPENILIHNDALNDGFETPGLVKLTDFGLGRIANVAAANSIQMSASMSPETARDIAGTLDYMAPEQRSGDPIDQRVDLFACGVILYELLTGERPVGHEKPSELNGLVPPWLDEIYSRSCARLGKRYASADQFLAALQEQGSAGFAVLTGLDLEDDLPVLPSLPATAPRLPPPIPPGNRRVLPPPIPLLAPPPPPTPRPPQSSRYGQAPAPVYPPPPPAQSSVSTVALWILGIALGIILLGFFCFVGSVRRR